MLNLNHPMTQHIFHASGLLDGLLRAGQRMSVSPSSVRFELLPKCLLRLEELRELARAHFSTRMAFIAAAIDEFGSGLRKLADFGDGQITEDHRDGTGNCPVCSTTITHYKEWDLILCGTCVEVFRSAYSKLCGFDGFGTDAI